MMTFIAIIIAFAAGFIAGKIHRPKFSRSESMCLEPWGDA